MLNIAVERITVLKVETIPTFRQLLKNLTKQNVGNCRQTYFQTGYFFKFNQNKIALNKTLIYFHVHNKEIKIVNCFITFTTSFFLGFFFVSLY